MERYAKRIIIVAVFLIIAADAYSDEIYLKNKDRITGEIIEENDNAVKIKTEALGEIAVKRDFIERIEAEQTKEIAKEKKETPEIVWQREILAGYNATRGNTRDDELSMSFFINRNKKHYNEITLKGSVYLSSVDKETNAQKWYSMARYAFSFGKGKKWYNFYRIEADHNRFADIDYRLTPAAGIGYWFFDRPEFKLMAEVGGGAEHTDYKGDKDATDELILVPRAFAERDLFGLAKLSSDFYLYPALTDWGEYRLRSETSLAIPGRGNLNVRLSLINDYNSDPPEETKKHDMRFESSLGYSF